MHSPDPNSYFEPPDNFDYGFFIPLLRAGLGVVIVIGGIVLLFTIYFLITNAIKVMMGKASFSGRLFFWVFIGLMVGLLLIGGGWIGVINMMQRSIVEPGQNILQGS